MGYNENLYKSAVAGDKSSFKELEFNAGSGDTEAQYYLALCYAERKGGQADYEYWMKKAADNGYEAAKVSLPNSLIEETTSNDSRKEGMGKTLEGFLWIGGGLLLTIVTGGAYIFYGAVLYGLYLVVIYPFLKK